MASKHVGVTFDIDFDTSKVTSGVSELERKLSELKSNYKDALKVGDATGIKTIANKLKELNQEAAKVKETLGSFSDNENINIQLQSNVGDLQSQMHSFANTMSTDTATRMSSGIKSVTDKMYSFAKTALGKTLSYGKTVVTTGFNFAKAATTSWLSFMKSGLSSILDVWKGILSKITSSGKSSVSSIGSQLKSIMGYVSLAAVAALAKKSIDLGSSLFELQNVTDTVFGKMSSSIDDWAKNTASSFGLTEIQAKKMTGVFGGMLQASNIAESTSAKMSENLAALSGDLASFYNMDVSDTYEKLQSGLSGEVKAMRSFGVNMTVANMEAYALSQGITQSYKSMNQATQTTLRYNYMLSTLSKTQGDFARTQASWANQTRILANNFKQLFAIIGAGLIKVLYPTLIVLNKILSLAIQGANALAKMFGFTSKDLSSIYGSSNAQTATSDADDYADSLNDVSDATDNVADSTKKANSNLQSFDKLNNITSETNDSKSSGLGGLGLGSSIEPIDYADVLGLNDDVKIPAWLQAIVDFIKNAFEDLSSIDLSNLKSAWAEFAKAFGVIIKDIGKAIEWLWHNVLFPFIRWSAEQGIPAVLEFFAAGLRALHKVIEVVGPVIDRFWKKSLAPYFNAKGEAFVNMMHRWGDALDGWCKKLDESGDKLQYIKDTFTNMVFKITACFDVPDLTKQVNTLREKLKDSLNVVFDVKFNDTGEITQIFNQNTLEYIKQVAGLFLDISLITFNNILDVFSWFVGNMGVLNFLEKVVALVGELADITVTHAESIADKIAVDPKSVEALTNIKDVISDILDFIDRNTPRLVEFFDVITEHLKSIADYLNQDGTGDVLLDDLLDTLENIANWFDKNKETIVNALKVMGDAAKVLADHLGLVLGALVAINAFKLGADIIKTLNLFKSFFGLGGAASAGGLASAVGSAGSAAAGEVTVAGKGAASAVTAAGSLSAATIASATAVLATMVAGLLAAKKDIADAKDEKTRETKFTDYDSGSDAAKSSIESNGGKLFNTKNITEYASKIQEVTHAYNDMCNSAKIVSQGSAWDNVFSIKNAQADLKEYLATLQQVGYTNTDNMTKLNDLVNQNVGILDRKDWASSVNDIMTSIQTEMSTEANAISTANDAEFAKMSLKCQDYGKESAINWVNGYKTTGDNLDLSMISYNDLVSQFGVVGADAASEMITQMGLTLDSSDRSVKSKAATVIQSMTDGIGASKTSLIAAANKTSTETANALGSASSSCTASGETMTSNVASGMKTGASQVTAAADVVAASASSRLVDNTLTMQQSGELWVNSIASGLKCVSPVAAAVNAVLNVATERINTGSSSMAEAGSNLTRGIARGLQDGSAMSSLSGAVGAIVSHLVSWFEDKCKIHSPSRLFAGIAEYIPAGIAVGINNGASSATSAISSLVDDMTSGFDSASINSTSFLDDTKFSDFFSTVSADAKTFASGLSDTLSGIGFSGINTGDMLGKVSDLTGLNLNASVASSQESSNSAVSSLLSNISSASNSRGGNSNGKVYATIYLDANNELGKFIIDTVNGNVVTTGGF